MFDDHVRFQAGVRPAAPAIITPAGALSFAALEAEVARTALILAGARGVDAVGIDIADPVEHWIAILALARLRVTSAPPGHGTVALSRIAPLPTPRDTPRASPSPVGRILVTSATMGRERRVPLSWAMIDAGIRNAPLAYGMPDGPVLAATGPQTIMGFIMTLTAWAKGNAVLMGCGPPTPDLLRAYRPRMICFVPAMLRDLVNAMTQPYDAPLKLAVGGGGVPPVLAARARERMGPDLVGVYGATETGAIAITGGDTLQQRSGAAGHVLPDADIRIAGPDGQPLQDGETGEIWARGPRVAEGYLDDAEASADRFRDGWFRTGDLGRREPDGLLLVEGRIDDTMNLAGIKTLPGWIEDAALACPQVADAGVVALHGADGITICCLCVVAPDGVSQDALASVLSEPIRRLGRIDWRIVPSIPRNAMGKIDRTALRAVLDALPRLARPTGERADA